MTATAPTPISKVLNNQVTFHGKVVLSTPIKRRDGSDGYATVLDLPSADEFSNKQTVEILSVGQLGHVGSIVNPTCIITGYRRKMNGSEGRPDWFKTDHRFEAV